MNSEFFLQFIWKFGLFNKDCATTADGKKIKIISLGTFNANAGPDFFNAKIQIDDIIWCGNIEIHVNASDWNKHKHNADDAYNNVILHVVQNIDCQIARADGKKIPTYKICYNPQYEQRYKELQESHEHIPCQKYVKNIDAFRIKYFLGRLAAERLEQRSAHIRQILDTTKNDFKEAFYRLLFRAFGFGVNALPFEMLAQCTPIAAINKHRNSTLQLEAILFGQAGFLNGNAADEYQNKLQKEYCFLQNKFNLKPMEKHVWKFLRLRPTNFPTVRIAQLAAFLHHSDGLLAVISNFKESEEIISFFNFCASEYWDTHYVFGKNTNIVRKKTFGKTSTDKILINVIAPYIFTLGKAKADQNLCDKALDLLEKINPEKNSITSGWADIGIKADNSLYTQALIQLKTEYCDKKRCLQCHIGNEIIKMSKI